METNAVIKHLIDLFHEQKLAHAYLIETNNINRCLIDVKKIIKSICCPECYEEICNKCNLCHLINENSLPNLIIVEPDGKNIKKEAIENLKNAFTKKPIYTNKNIYIVKYPEKMNDTAFNKMLKFLEEPEADIIGFFITENKDNVANTIVSRCEILRMNYHSDLQSDYLGIDEETYQKYLQLACQYQKEINSNSNSIVWYNNSVLNKELPTRIEITIFLKILLNLYMEDLNNNVNILLHKRIKIIAKYLEELNYNVNTSLLLDSLVIEMGELHGK